MHDQSFRSDVFLVGQYFLDLIFAGLSEVPRLGHEIYSRGFHMLPGGIANAAIALHRLGLDLVWPVQFGNDLFSQTVKAEALREGINGDHFSDIAQASIRITAAFSTQNERGFLSYTDPLPIYAYSDLIRETKPQWIYVSHLLCGEQFQDLITSGRSVHAKIFMDCQAHHHTIDEDEIRKALRQVDIFSLNRAEAAVLTSKSQIKDMLQALSSFAPVVVIKDGANGSYLRKGSKVIHAPAEKVDVVDTTGAGDNFDCGFLFGRIKGYSWKESLQIGNICGSYSVQGYGGSSTSPTEHQLLKTLQKNLNNHEKNIS